MRPANCGTEEPAAQTRQVLTYVPGATRPEGANVRALKREALDKLGGLFEEDEK